jgi:hypothetical protein
MTPIEKLETKIRELYDAASPELKVDWTDWLYKNHVFVVAAKARELAPLFNADPNLAAAGGMLHDIADVKLRRADLNHAKTTLEIADQLLRSSGFSDDDINVLIEDALPNHRGREGVVPKTAVGKALSAGDAYVHLMTDFYVHGIWAMGLRGEDLEWTKDWAREKIERDYKVKTMTPEIRQMTRHGYESLKFLLDGNDSKIHS